MSTSNNWQLQLLAYINSRSKPSNVPQATEQNEAKSEQPNFAVEITHFMDKEQDEVNKWIQKYIKLEIGLDAFKGFFKEYGTKEWVKSEGVLRVCQSIVNLLVEEELDFGLTLDKYKRAFRLFCDRSTIAPTEILPELLLLMEPLICYRNINFGDYFHYVETPPGFWKKHRNVCLMLMIGFESCGMNTDRYTRFQMLEYISWIIQGDTVQSETELYAVKVVHKIAIKYGLFRKDIINSMVRLSDLVELNEIEQFDTFKHQTRHCARFCVDNFQFENFNKAILKTKVILSPDKRSARCITDRPITVYCPFKLSTGSYYFEVTLVTAGQMRIGWSPVETFDKQAQLGVIRNSIAIDGYNKQIWHNWKSFKIIDLPSWKAGDVIGCLIETSNKNFIFYLNGEHIRYNLQIKFSPPYFAAVTLFSEQQCKFNFGETPFLSLPLNYSTVDNSQNYLHNSLVIPERKIEHFNDELQSSVDETFKKWLLNTEDKFDTTEITAENITKSLSKNYIPFFTFKILRISAIQNRLYQSAINLVNDEANLHEFKVNLFRKFETSFKSSELFGLIENQIEYFNVHRNCLLMILWENIEDLFKPEYLTKILKENDHMETILYALRIILLDQILSQLNQKYIERIQNALLHLLKQLNARKLFDSNSSSLISKLPSSIKDGAQLRDIIECVQNLQFNSWDTRYVLEYQICLCVFECFPRLYESVPIKCKPAQYRRAMLSSSLLSVGMDNLRANSVPTCCIFEIVSGVYYFEVMLLSNGPVRIGYISNKIDNKDHQLVRMIGDDTYSIGLDLYHKCIWYDLDKIPITNIHDYKCKMGDVVGCTIDAAEGKVTFYVNGTLIEFNSRSEFQILAPGPYYAATSIEHFQYCAFNFGQLPFKHKVKSNFKNFHTETNGERRRYSLKRAYNDNDPRLTKTRDRNEQTNPEPFSQQEMNQLDYYFKNISPRNHRDENVRNIIMQHTLLNDHRKIQLLDSMIKHFGKNIHDSDAIEPILVSHFDIFNIEKFENAKILENFIYDAIAKIDIDDCKHRERNTWIVIWILFTNRDISEIIPQDFLCHSFNETNEPMAQLVALLFLERYTQIEKMIRQTINEKLIELAEYFDQLSYSTNIDLLRAQIGLCARVLLDRATPRESKIKTLENLGGRGNWILQNTECPLFVSGRCFWSRDWFSPERANKSTILFYEIILLTSGPMTIGWQILYLDDDLKKNRKNSLFETETEMTVTNMDTWKAKDVVGCLIDTTKNSPEFKFYLNGNIMELKNYSKIVYEESVNAYICLSERQQVIINFGLTPFLYPPKDVQYESFYELAKQTHNN